MPKSLRLSELQIRVFNVIQMEGNIPLEHLAISVGLSTIETKSICLVLIARKLIEKNSKEGRLVYCLR